MKRNLFWKLLIVLFVVAWASYEAYPPKGKNLAQEFKRRAVSRDANFTNIVTELDKLETKFPQRTYGNLIDAIGTNQIARYFPFVNAKGEEDVNRAVLNKLQKDASGQIKLGLDLQGGTSFLVGIDTNALNKELASQAGYQEAVLEQAVEVLRKRVDRFGVAEPIILPQGKDRILIQLPGLSEADKESARKQIERVAFLEFKMVHPQSEELLQQSMPEPGYEVRYELRKNQDGTKVRFPYMVRKKPVGMQDGTNFVALTGKHISQAYMSRDPVMGTPMILFEMNSEGAQIFADVTRANRGQRMAIVLDGEVYSAPTINEPIETGRGQITGAFDDQEARELANILENPLETPVKILEQRGVDPSLGKDSIQSGIRASIIGAILVGVFMLVYYLLAGSISVVAMLLNVLILLGVMCSLDATMTLPGIAGIVLTIGMAVDANVLIFERIREELDAGKSLRGAVSAGYDKAFGTIFDSNLTTLISSIILIYMGTGPVKGFGVSLTIGIATSMFTALFVTRLIFDWLLANNMIQSLPMLRIVKKTQFNFLRWAVPAFVLSWAVILIGIGYGVKRGHDVYGVDFAGGDSLTLSFKQAVPVDQLRQAISDVKIGEPQIQYQTSLVDNKQTLQVLSEFGSGTKVESVLKEKFPQAGWSVLARDEVGPSVGKEIQRTAILAGLLSVFGILVYVAFRYEFSFAVAAVVAIFHDVLMTMGWFFLTGRELSAPMVAAILTIIGFSINDTIVIFDRVREDLKLGARGSFKDILNHALNQTLSRTIITSGTVFLSTLSLYLFGGGVINDFAFTFLVGILTGTYSTIYIASAIVLWWHKGERPKLGSSVILDKPNPAPSTAP